MDQERLVGKLVRPALQALDYDLVRVQLSTEEICAFKLWPSALIA